MRILLVEDDENLRNSLLFQLKKEGIQSDWCDNGLDALEFIKQNSADVILLDRMLPELDGLSVLKKIRSEGITTPVIVTTALGELHDKVEGLDYGADDYLTKPFAFEELLARIRCIRRRPARWEGNDTVSYKDCTLSTTDLTLAGPSGTCSLSKKESNLFDLFFHNQNQTLPRDLLLSKVWGAYASVENGNLDNYIHFLRRRLKTVGSSLSLITVRGIGFKLE